MKCRAAFPPVAAMALAALVASLTLPAAGQASGGDSAQVGKWKTFVLSSGSEIPVPAPPADDSAQTKAELAELRLAQTLRTPSINTAINFWNSVPATQRWVELTQTLAAQNRLSGNGGSRAHALVATAMYDAVVAAYHAKYTYNRKPPSAVANDLIPSATVPAEPSYPSEHAAMAGAAAGVLAYLFPKEEKALTTMALEAAHARLLAGTNYRSDVEAGLALGSTVAQKAAARAATDGFDTKWTGTVPTGPGLWTVPPGAEPLEPLAGTWKPWFLTSGSQFRPGPPPKFGSPEFQADLDEVKRINASLSPAEREVAVFWATMSGGIWQRTAHALIARDKLSTPRAVRVLAFLGAAVFDSGIACWDGKYTYWRIRPFQADPSIQPPITAAPHPTYPAGAGCTWGTAADVLMYYFPQDASRLRYLQEQAWMSRLFGGIHFRTDIDAGAEIARKVAELAAQRDRMNEN